MNLRQLILLLLVAFSSLGLQSCLKDTCTRSVSYTLIEPVYVNIAEVRSIEITAESPRAIELPGLVVSYDHHIYVNEKGKGIHVIDNTNPITPFKIAFLSIPGNYNFAINNGALYANSYVDLLVFDLNGITDGAITDQIPFQPASRIPNVFNAVWEDEANGQIAFQFTSTPLTETLDCETYGTYLSNKYGELVKIDEQEFFAGNDFSVVNSLDSSSMNLESQNLNEASFAQFTIVDNQLVAINREDLGVFSLENPLQPVNTGNFVFGPGVLKLDKFQDKLLIASQSSNLVYNLDYLSNPAPSNFILGATACDPIAFSGNLAFVSKNGEAVCNTSEPSQLYVTEVVSLDSISTFLSFPMQDPQGLAVHDDLLFLCDGVDGLKIYDLSDYTLLNQHLVRHLNDLQAYQVLLDNIAENFFIVVGADGIYQYNYSPPSNASSMLVSKINFN